jgi:hypothetical protein
MEVNDKNRLLADFHSTGPVNETALKQFERDSQFQLPETYIQFLRQMNGGEGFIGDEYVILWAVEELLKMNSAYEVPEYAPDLFLFGSNGGGEAYAFDKRSNSSIVTVPFVGMDMGLTQPQAQDFRGFIERLSRS